MDPTSPAPPFAAVPPLARLGGLLRRRRVRALLQVLIVGLILLFFARAVAREWDDIRAYQWQVQPGYLLAGIGLTILRGPVILSGWRAVLARLGYPLGWRAAVRVYFTSGMAKYLPGSLWFALGRVLLAEGEGVPRRVTGLSIGIETALITVAALTVATLGLTALPAVPVWPYAVVGAGLLAFLIWPGPAFAVLNRGLGLLGRAPVDIRLGWRDLARWLPLFLANWVVYGLISYCWTAAVFPPLTAATLPSLTGLYAAAWVIGFLALVVPNGWGVREGALITGLTGLLGLPLAAAGAAAVLSRLGGIAGEAIWAALAIRLKRDA
jgi:uncharacterized membrane protein YbhN (UPF0104 family)